MSDSSVLSSSFGSVSIENDQRFSASILWKLQRAYYQQRGIEAWNQGSVPHYITNNPVIASAYARVVTGFLRDCLRQPADQDSNALALDPDYPIYIVEPGAGSGRFAYHFLKQFLPMLENPDFRALRVVYVITDIVEQNVDFWRQHPKLQPFFEAGRLDIAQFDPLHDAQINLLVSGKTLQPGNLKNPLIVLANYFLCAIPMDIFSVEQGILREELVKTVSTNNQFKRDDPAILPYLSIQLRPRFAPVNYYPEEEDNLLLQEYARLINHAYISFPHSALSCLRNLAKLSGERLLLLAGDRGFINLEALRSMGEPKLSLHGNSVSMPVNFHAIGKFFTRRDGRVFLSQHREEGLIIAACTLGHFLDDCVGTRTTFQESVDDGGPDDFFQLKKAVEGNVSGFDLNQLLAFLRISCYDGNIFSVCATSLQQQAADATEMQREKLYHVLCNVWDMYYPIGEPQNVPEQLARIFIAISCYQEALTCLHWSLSLYGKNDAVQQMMQDCQSHSWNFDDVQSGLGTL